MADSSAHLFAGGSPGDGFSYKGQTNDTNQPKQTSSFLKPISSLASIGSSGSPWGQAPPSGTPPMTSSSSSSGVRRAQSRHFDTFSTGPETYDLWKDSASNKQALPSASPGSAMDNAWTPLGSKMSNQNPSSPVLSTTSRSSDHASSVSPGLGATNMIAASPDASAMFLGPNANGPSARTQPIPLPGTGGSAQPQAPATTTTTTTTTTTRSSSVGSTAADDELIPTAIVIKNIPFAIKKEQLLDVMTSLGLPLPYAFNYHFDNGVFRGLAFANFTSPDETATVISHLNGREIGGRKLRVEYKKMLPLAERERIEREKRERRGQLEEQHRGGHHHHQKPHHGQGGGSGGNHVTGNNHSGNSHGGAGSQSSHGGNGGHSLSSSVNSGIVSANSATNPSTNSNNPSNNNANVVVPPAMHQPKLDLNDPETLELYSQLLLFRDDKSRSEFAFGTSLIAQQRRTLLLLCGQLGLVFAGNNDNVVLVTKHTPSPGGVLPPLPGFVENIPPQNGSPAANNSVHQPPASFFQPQQLRGTKSFADIRAPIAYPYNMSAPGTPNGSPFFQSHTPPPNFQHIPPYHLHGDAANVNNAAGSSNVIPMTFQQQQRGHHHQLMQQPPVANFDHMTTLSDNFSNMVMGGSSSAAQRVSSVTADAAKNDTNPNVNSNNNAHKSTTASSASSITSSNSSKSKSPVGVIGSKGIDVKND